jgi:hypothetical protein
MLSAIQRNRHNVIALYVASRVHYGIFAFRPERNQNTQRILLSLNVDLESIAIMIPAENVSLVTEIAVAVIRP